MGRLAVRCLKFGEIRWGQSKKKITEVSKVTEVTEVTEISEVPKELVRVCKKGAPPLLIFFAFFAFMFLLFYILYIMASAFKNAS